MKQSEHLTNILENTACRVAQLQCGRLNPHHLMPCLPVSLEMICEGLNGMVDGVAVQVGADHGIQEYLFTEYLDQPATAGGLHVSNCIACSADLSANDKLFCSDCSALMEKELSLLAEKTGWPAQAVYEHEILYLAARHSGPVSAETLAGASNFTLRSMKKKLSTLAAIRMVDAEPGEKSGLLRYQFPAIQYPKSNYQANQQVIRSYPASVMEDVEQRVVRILFVLGGMFFVLIALAFWGIPFVLLVPVFLVLAPVLSLIIWRHKNKIKEV